MDHALDYKYSIIKTNNIDPIRAQSSGEPLIDEITSGFSSMLSSDAENSAGYSKKQAAEHDLEKGNAMTPTTEGSSSRGFQHTHTVSSSVPTKNST